MLTGLFQSFLLHFGDYVQSNCRFDPFPMRHIGWNSSYLTQLVDDYRHSYHMVYALTWERALAFSFSIKRCCLWPIVFWAEIANCDFAEAEKILTILRDVRTDRRQSAEHSLGLICLFWVFRVGVCDLPERTSSEEDWASCMQNGVDQWWNDLGEFVPHLFHYTFALNSFRVLNEE